MKSHLILILLQSFFLYNSPMEAQSAEPPAQVSNLWKINIFLPGMSYEQKITRLSTLNIDIYMDALLVWPDKWLEQTFQVFFTPSFKAEYRTYYNLDRRFARGLRTANNNGNYFAPVYIGRYSIVNEYDPYKWVNELGAVWGFQRSYPSGFSLDFNVGLVYNFNPGSQYYYDPIMPVTQLRLGFILGNKQRKSNLSQ